MIAPVERDEARARNAGGKPASLLERLRSRASRRAWAAPKGGSGDKALTGYAPRLDGGSPVTATVKAVEPFDTEMGRHLLGVRLLVVPHKLKRQARR
jgi:hypothetical protein